MNSNEIIFTSHCFHNPQSEDYYKQQIRLKESILKIYPDANLLFTYDASPEGKANFQKSLYGFKVDLVRECLAKGFKKIVFFDTAICLEHPIDYWFDIIKDYGVLAPIDRQTLDTVTSDDCLKYNTLTRDQVSKWNLVGGSIYVFDFNLELCQNIFNSWSEMERDGIFGTQDDLSNGMLQNHRMDETCMAIALAFNGISPLGHDVMKYAYEHPQTKDLHSMGKYNPLVIKRHFK